MLGVIAEVQLSDGQQAVLAYTQSVATSEVVGQSIYAKLWLNPPQIATEAFSSDLLPESCPE